jgi:ATP-binding cassette subfamily B protein
VKRHWIKNLFYCLGDVARENKFAIFALILNILVTPAFTLMGTLTSYYVVLKITSGAAPEDYLATLGILVAITFFLNALMIWSTSYYSWASTFARCSSSWLRMTNKAITTDYLNVEPREKRKTFEKAFMALDSNWVGIEGMMKQAPLLAVGLIGFLTYGIIAAIYVPWILLVMGAMLLVSVLLAYWADNFIRRTRDESERLYTRGEVLRTDTTSWQNAKDIRAYRLDQWFLRVYDVLTRETFHYNQAVERHLFVGEVSDNLFLFLRDLVAYSILIVEVTEGRIDLATFTFLIGIVAGFSTWVNSLVKAMASARKESVLIDDYRNALQVKDFFNHGPGLDTKTLQKPLGITFDHVSFSYPGDKKEVIHDLNLTIAPGEKIALVGNNGAGKTTLIKLLCGLYAPTAGRILIDGHNIQEFNNDDYMDLIGALFQDATPLSLSLLTNVTCQDDDDADLPKFWAAVEKAGLKEKIESLPDKEQTYVTQTFNPAGIELSGGETQKLLLARALYKNAPLLVLDEPTSALDPLSEEAMYRQYLSLTANATSIFISHRLASTRFCDRVIFLDNGSIEEIGTHEELVKGHKKYQETFEIQAKYYREGADHETF